jgi:hypothetical protein
VLYRKGTDATKVNEFFALFGNQLILRRRSLFAVIISPGIAQSSRVLRLSDMPLIIYRRLLLSSVRPTRTDCSPAKIASCYSRGSGKIGPGD